MSHLNQKTVKKTISFNGIGLHNGQASNISIKPGKPNSGIIFKRVDLSNNNYVVPNFAYVTNTALNTKSINGLKYQLQEWGKKGSIQYKEIKDIFA